MGDGTRGQETAGLSQLRVRIIITKMTPAAMLSCGQDNFYTRGSSQQRLISIGSMLLVCRIQGTEYWLILSAGQACVSPRPVSVPASPHTDYSWNKYLAYRGKNCADQTVAPCLCLHLSPVFPDNAACDTSQNQRHSQESPACLGFISLLCISVLFSTSIYSRTKSLWG